MGAGGAARAAAATASAAAHGGRSVCEPERERRGSCGRGERVPADGGERGALAGRGVGEGDRRWEGRGEGEEGDSAGVRWRGGGGRAVVGVGAAGERVLDVVEDAGGGDGGREGG